jgi:hypothetical protein
MGLRGILNTIGSEFHQRVMPLRLVARICISRPPLLRATISASGVAARLFSILPGSAGQRLSYAAYSVIFNLLFWEGVAEEIGDDAFWDLVRRNQPAPEGKAEMVARGQ